MVIEAKRRIAAGDENSKITMDNFENEKYNKPEESVAVVNGAFKIVRFRQTANSPL